MNKIIQNIVARRSVRKFQERQVDEESLTEILLAASYAPSASGRQSPLIVVCQNEKINAELGKINRALAQQIRAGPVFQQINAQTTPTEQTQADTPKDTAGIADPALESAFYGAPTVITLFAPKNWYNFTIDCAVAAQNITLAAHSLGVSSCIIARALETFETETGKNYMKAWNIDETYEGKIHVLLGYMNGASPEAKPRKEGHILRIN
jgi:nitroreductase